jgi:hypothetical protein
MLAKQVIGMKEAQKKQKYSSNISTGFISLEEALGREIATRQLDLPPSHRPVPAIYRL